MDLNAFIFRDDTADILGSETGDGFDSFEATLAGVMTAKTGRAAGGDAMLDACTFRDVARQSWTRRP